MSDGCSLPLEELEPQAAGVYVVIEEASRPWDVRGNISSRSHEPLKDVGKKLSILIRHLATNGCIASVTRWLLDGLQVTRAASNDSTAQGLI